MGGRRRAIVPRLACCSLPSFPPPPFSCLFFVTFVTFTSPSLADCLFRSFVSAQIEGPTVWAFYRPSLSPAGRYSRSSQAAVTAGGGFPFPLLRLRLRGPSPIHLLLLLVPPPHHWPPRPPLRPWPSLCCWPPGLRPPTPSSGARCCGARGRRSERKKTVM